MLRRSRADWPVVLASLVLLASALGLLSAGTLYTDAVTLAGLHRELRDAPPAESSIVVRTQILPDRLPPADAAITPELEGVLGVTGGELVRVVRSSPFADAATDKDAVTDLVLFASYEAVREHAPLTGGAWPEPGADPVQVAVSDAGAGVLGVAIGDVIPLVGRLDGRPLTAVVTGTFRPDPADRYWLGEPLALAGTEEGGSFTLVGPLIADPADLLGTLAGGRPVDAQWRAIPDLGGFRPENLELVATGVTALPGEINAALPQSNQATLTTKLPQILASVDRSVLVAQAGILLLLVQFGVLAGYAVVLVAALLVDRRRTETALLLARGAGFGHQVRMAFYEAVLIVVPAVVVAPWLAMLLVAAVSLNPALDGVGLSAPLPGPATFGVSAGVGLLALLALTLPTLAGGVSIAGVRAGVGRQLGRTLPQRLGLDLALVLLAVVALLQLRLYGAPLTRNARGSLGVDPLLVAAPAIGLLGGAVLAIRIVPRLAELAERVLSRGRGLVPSLGGRQLARRPLRYTRAALLLVLAAALGTFASAHAATWTRSQADQAAYAAGADVRLEPGARSALPGWSLGEALRAVPAVTIATPVVNASVSLGSALRDGTLLAVDGPALADVVRLRSGPDADATRDALRALADGQPGVPGPELPGGTQRISLLLDSTLTADEGFTPIPDGHAGLRTSIVVMDGDGRLARIAGTSAALNADGVRSEVALTVPGTDGALRGPVHLLAVDLELSLAGIPNSIASGSVTVLALGTSPDETGDTWIDTSVADLPSATWSRAEGDNGPWGPVESDPPGHLEVELAARETWRLALATVETPEIAAVANPVFLERTGAEAGDTVKATVFGMPVTMRLVGTVTSFPTQPPSKPLLVADGRSLDLARYARGVSLGPTSEWWLATTPGATSGVAATVAAPPIAAATAVDRETLQADLVSDPLGLGVIGILGLGSVAALVFAAIGFLVTTTVSTQERLAEFALLKALGLAPRQLLAWLSFESVALLAVGLIAGTLLGLVLAWLALPFATLTASGEPPVPTPVVVVPPEALVPTLGLAVVLLLATVLLVGRLVPAARTSAVLRARDE
ncbi:MAG TPA: ABC transporter permease [Candidatus Limnocylindrales bacterium]|nr:ABC transporter permease [Candidatus Limnocylindrales bacterium]